MRIALVAVLFTFAHENVGHMQYNFNFVKNGLNNVKICVRVKKKGDYIMLKKILSLCLVIVLFITITPTSYYADEGEVITSEISLDNITMGDEIVVYDNTETGERMTISIQPVKTARVDQGTGDWSGGSIPGNTYVLYASYESNYYVEIVFAFTFNGATGTIIDVFGESIDSNWGEIDDISSRVVNATATSNVPAKAQMNWIYEGFWYQGLSCYLRVEINYFNQMRIAWRVNDAI